MVEAVQFKTKYIPIDVLCAVLVLIPAGNRVICGTMQVAVMIV
jgi:hypothetical protein